MPDGPMGGPVAMAELCYVAFLLLERSGHGFVSERGQRFGVHR
jgi:hypothetical protein